MALKKSMLSGAARAMSGSRKGVLLTLLTIILFLLMLSEVISYVVISTNYITLAQSTSSALDQGFYASLVKSVISETLHTSLSNALSALVALDSNPQIRRTTFIDNGSYAIKSLMMNGTVYGLVLSNYMGSATMGNIKSDIASVLGQQGVNITIRNASLSVFQNSSSAVSATYTGMLVVNGTAGTFLVPLNVSASVPLNGTYDIAAYAAENPSVISIAKSYPQAAVLSGTGFNGGHASLGSTSPFMFAYGTIITEIPGVTCSQVPSWAKTTDYILYTTDSSNLPQSVCGMGGLISTTGNATAPLVPYLYYNTAANMGAVLQDGIKVLLDGPALEVLNVTPIQNAMAKGQYFASQYSPSYLQQIGDAVGRVGSSAGLFSFNLLNRKVPFFSGTSTSNIGNIDDSKFPSGSQSVSIFAWIRTTTAGNNWMAFQYGGYNLAPYGNSWILGDYSGKACADTWNYGICFGGQSLNDGKWHLLGLTYQGSNPGNYVTLYVDGASYTGSIGNLPNVFTGSGTSAHIGYGASFGASPYFVGEISGVELYNASLNASQVADIYMEGPAGRPPASAGKSLVGWWPLNGDANDYSGQGHDGTLNAVSFREMYDYAGPFTGSPLASQNLGTAEGVLNCANPNQCSDRSLSHMYFGNQSIADVGGSPENASTAFGLPQGTFPSALYVNGSSCLFSHMPGIPFKESMAVSMWVYPLALGAGSSPSTANVIYSEGNSRSSVQIAYTSLGSIDVNGYNESDVSTPTGSVPLNKWTNIILTATSSSETIYINGALSASGSGPANNNLNQNLSIGGTIGGTNYLSQNNFIGYISDVKLWLGSISAAQAQQWYSNDSIKGGIPDYWWPLQSGTSASLSNQSIGGGTACNSCTYQYSSLPAIAYYKGSVCSNANMIAGLCGAWFGPT